MSAPKLFVSYSWSSPQHEQWVLDIAASLIESGIDVILDKWELKEGHDAVAFMEQMVIDPKVGKVILITDRTYAEKADGRSGGVGTETQIISKEVYDNQKQEKFVAVVAEKDGNGNAYLPTYYKSRIYIDLSEPDSYTENFERLLRWVFDKPLYVKPELGHKPAFLEADSPINLGTGAAHKRAIGALKEGKSTASGALDECLNIFSENLERFRISTIDGEEFDDTLVKNLEQFLPFRNEMLEVFLAIARYAPSEEHVLRVHRFFESTLPYMDRPEDIISYNDWDFDNYIFLVHELFLYCLAILLRYERFELANTLLSNPYYVPLAQSRGASPMVGFSEFRKYAKSIEHRNKRLELRKLSLRAQLLEERSKSSGLEFRYLMQADFVLFMRAEIGNESQWIGWWPETLLYLFRFRSAFEIFARAVSAQYFERVKIILGVEKKSDLEEILARFKSGEKKLPRWEINSFSPDQLLGYDELATKP